MTKSLLSSTITAIPIVHTNHAAAFRASPPHFFVFEKLSYPNASNAFKVLDHTHRVFGPVSFIEMLQTITGKLPAFKTKSCFGFLKELTVLDFAFHPRNGFINISAPATRTFISFPQVSHTN